jgi:hypothetical protein
LLLRESLRILPFYLPFLSKFPFCFICVSVPDAFCKRKIYQAP